MTPGGFIAKIEELFPKYRWAVEHFRQGKGKSLPDWPDWCYMPIAGAVAINLKLNSNYFYPAAIACAATWATTRGIYRFDRDVYDALIETEIKAIPADTLFRLPEWCVFVETHFPGTQGFFAWLEWDERGRVELRLIWLLSEKCNMSFHIQCIHLTDDNGNYLSDIIEGQKAATDESLKNLINIPAVLDQFTRQNPDMPESAKELVGNPSKFTDYLLDHRLDADTKVSRETSAALSLLLYLCSDDREFEGPPHCPLPGNPASTVKMVKGGKIFPIEPKTTVYQTAFHLGKQLRAAYENANNNTTKHVSPHIRRAHWHIYRIGQGRKQTTVKWISPILVGGSVEDRDHIRLVREKDHKPK